MEHQAKLRLSRDKGKVTIKWGWVDKLQFESILNKETAIALAEFLTNKEKKGKQVLQKANLNIAIGEDIKIGFESTDELNIYWYMINSRYHLLFRPQEFELFITFLRGEDSSLELQPVEVSGNKIDLSGMIEIGKNDDSGKNNQNTKETN